MAAGASARTPRPRSRTDPRPAPSAPARRRRRRRPARTGGSGSSGSARALRRPAATSTHIRCASPSFAPIVVSACVSGSSSTPKRRRRGRRSPGAGSGSRDSTSSGGCAGSAPPRAASRPPARATAGRGCRSRGRSRPSPARRSSSFSSLIVAKTYGGRAPTRRSSIQQHDQPIAVHGLDPPRTAGEARTPEPRRSPWRRARRRARRARRRRPPRTCPRRRRRRRRAGCLRPSTSARRAPASTTIRPRTGLPKRSQSLKAGSLRSAAAKRVPRGSPARIGSSTDAPVPPAITVGIPAAAASSAASTLLRIPPLPSGLAVAERGVARLLPLGEQLGARRSGRAGVDAVDLGEQDEQPRAQQHRDLRGERVVVAERDLVGGRGVVLVHDRDGAEPEQRVQGASRVDVGRAVADVPGGEQHLGGVERRERLVPRGLEAGLTERGGGLELGDAAGPPVEPEPRQTERDRARRDDAHRLAAADDPADLAARAPGARRGERGRPRPTTRLDPELDDDRHRVWLPSPTTRYCRSHRSR